MGRSTPDGGSGTRSAQPDGVRERQQQQEDQHMGRDPAERRGTLNRWNGDELVSSPPSSSLVASTKAT